jgi:hypothetical protein
MFGELTEFENGVLGHQLIQELTLMQHGSRCRLATQGNNHAPHVGLQYISLHLVGLDRQCGFTILLRDFSVVHTS